MPAFVTVLKCIFNSYRYSNYYLVYPFGTHLVLGNLRTNNIYFALFSLSILQLKQCANVE